MALVTSRLKPTTYQGLDIFGIEKFFDVIITADDVTKHKPDPQPIDIALKNLESSREQAVMVGDTKQDILCAKNAGVPAGELERGYSKGNCVGRVCAGLLFGNPGTADRFNIDDKRSKKSGNLR